MDTKLTEKTQHFQKNNIFVIKINKFCFYKNHMLKINIF